MARDKAAYPNEAQIASEKAAALESELGLEAGEILLEATEYSTPYEWEEYEYEWQGGAVTRGYTESVIITPVPDSQAEREREREIYYRLHIDPRLW